MNWTNQILGGLPDAIWFPGAWLTGNKKKIGWVVIFLANVMWLVFSLYVRSWILVFWCLVGMGMSVRNYRKWRTDGWRIRKRKIPRRVVGVATSAWKGVPVSGVLVSPVGGRVLALLRRRCSAYP